MEECDINGPTLMEEKPDMPKVVSHENAVEKIVKPIDAVVENTEEQSDHLIKETDENSKIMDKPGDSIEPSLPQDEAEHSTNPSILGTKDGRSGLNEQDATSILQAYDQYSNNHGEETNLKIENDTSEMPDGANNDSSNSLTPLKCDDNPTVENISNIHTKIPNEEIQEANVDETKIEKISQLNSESANGIVESSNSSSISSPAATSVTSGLPATDSTSIYQVKWITNNPSERASKENKNAQPNENNSSTNSALPGKIGIVTQNENGPCPLLSLVNVLLIQKKLTLPEGCEVISAEQLLEYIG